MAIKVHNSTALLLALLTLTTVSGCFCLAIPLPGENQCPTDARRLYCTCGEEAVRRCPCGPDSEFYGLKPTCWREWPEGWQCNGCEGMPYVDRALCGAPVDEAPPASAAPTIEAPVHAEADVSNPFRSKSVPADLPLPPQTRPITPTQSAPAKSAPVQLNPAQPTPTVPPAMDKVPAVTPPAKPAPTESAPSAKKSTTERPVAPATIIVIASPKAPVAAPPIAPAVQAEATVPQPMPIVPAAVKMTPPAPMVIAPQNAATQASVAKPNPSPVDVGTAVNAEIKQAASTTVLSPTKTRADDPSIPNRVEHHLINNLRL